MSTVTLNADNFGPLIDNNEIVIIDVGADWCAPCKAFDPAFEAAANQNPDVIFAKMNTEEEHALAAYFSIRTIPSVMVFREQVLLYNEPGAMDEAAIDQLLNYIKELDMNQIRHKVAEATEDVVYN
jgi:thioredoxin-like negative regulator of GroEL